MNVECLRVHYNFDLHDLEYVLFPFMTKFLFSFINNHHKYALPN